ncbi:hypothetical protein ACJX0J_008857, partial [Zea mays]
DPLKFFPEIPSKYSTDISSSIFLLRNTFRIIFQVPTNIFFITFLMLIPRALRRPSSPWPPRCPPSSAIIHRTVRCATGLSGAPAEQRLQHNGRLQRTPAKCVAQDHLPRWKTLPPLAELWYCPDKNASNPEASKLFKE